MNRQDAIDIIKRERDMVQKEIDVGQGTRREYDLVTAYNLAIKALQYVERGRDIKKARKKVESVKTMPTYIRCPKCGGNTCQQFSWDPPMWYCFDCHDLLRIPSGGDENGT